MVSATAPLPRRPRTGLVLGAGGVLGAAWMAGALAALQRRLPYPVGTLDLIVGTSAGSVMAAALRCSVVQARGIGVTVLTPGPEDLAAIGANLMDPRRRLRVLDTSLRTSAAALAELESCWRWAT